MGDAESVHNLLQRLGGVDRATAEAELTAIAARDPLAYVLSLIVIVESTAISSDSRMMAVIMLKNTIKSSWRSGKVDLSRQIRDRLQKLVLEDRSGGTVLTLLATALATLALHDDFPLDSLVDGIFAATQSNLPAALALLHQLLVDFSANRRHLIRLLANGSMTTRVCHLFQQCIMSSLDALSPASVSHLTASLRVVLNEVDLTISSAARDQLAYLTNLLVTMIQSRAWNTSLPLMVDICGILADSAAKHPLAFILPHVTPLLDNLIGALPICPPELAVVAMSFISWSFASTHQSGMVFNAKSGIQFDHESAKRFVVARDRCFSPQRTATLLQALIERHLIVTEDDLAHWAADPEVYFNGLEWNPDPALDSRTAAVILLTALGRCYSSLLGEILAQFLPLCFTAEATAANPLLAESCLFAVQSLVPFLQNTAVNFDALWENLLHRLLDHPQAALRRRVASVIGAGIRFSASPATITARGIAALIIGDSDIVVRLEAVQALDAHLKSASTLGAGGDTRVAELIPAIAQLLVETHQLESQTLLISCLGALIAVVVPSTSACLTTLLDRVPQLWVALADHNFLRASLITLIEDSLRHLPVDTALQCPIIFQIVNFALDQRQPDHLVLCESALQLWLCIIQQCSSLSTPIVELFTTFWSPLFSSDITSNASILIRLLESYTLLAGQEFLDYCGKSIVATLTSAFNSVPHLPVLCDCLATIATTCPTRFLADFHSILSLIVTRVVEHGDDIRRESSIADLLVVVARICLDDPNWVHLWTTANNGKLDTIVDTWLVTFGHIQTAFDRKISAMGLCALVICNRASVHRLGDVLRIALPVTSDELQLVTNLCGEPSEAHRRQKMVAQDPAHHISLARFIATRLQVIESDLGSAVFLDLLQAQRIDINVVEQLRSK